MKSYVIITGGSEGIGFELAKLFAKDKHNLILVARNIDKLNKAKVILRDFGVEIRVLAMDLADIEGCHQLIKYVEDNNLDIEVLVNNAGVGSFGEFKDALWEAEEKLLDINIKALTMLTNYFLPRIIKRDNGGILNVASTAAFSAGPKMATYYASKAYVLNLTEAIAEEVKDSNITVSCLCPGPVRTSFQGKAGIQKSAGAKKFLMEPYNVALAAYKGFNRGKVIIIPGGKNKFLVTINKFAPRSIVRKVILKTNEK